MTRILSPSIVNIELENLDWKKDHVLASSVEVNLSIEYLKYNNDSVIFEYKLFPEAFSNKIGGDIQKSPKPIDFEITNQSKNKITFISPKKKGISNICIYKKRKETKLCSQCTISNKVIFKKLFNIFLY